MSYTAPCKIFRSKTFWCIFLPSTDPESRWASTPLHFIFRQVRDAAKKLSDLPFHWKQKLASLEMRGYAKPQVVSWQILHFAILQLLIEHTIHHECMLPSRPPMAGNYALGPWKMFFVGQRETGTDHCQRQSDARCGRTITFTLPSLQRLILDPLCDAFDKILPAPDTYAALEDVTFWEFESNEFKHISIFIWFCRVLNKGWSSEFLFSVAIAT